MTVQADFLDELRELRARDAAFADMQEARDHYLRLVREEMVRRAHRRFAALGGGYSLSPDVARAFFEKQMQPAPPPPEELSRNFLALVFRGPEWVAVGTYRSTTPGSHGNRLNRYRLRVHMPPEELHAHEDG